MVSYVFLNAIMANVTMSIVCMLNAVMLSVIMLSAMMPCVTLLNDNIPSVKLLFCHYAECLGANKKVMFGVQKRR